MSKSSWARASVESGCRVTYPWANQITDDLRRSLLGDPEVLCHVGGPCITGTDPNEREAVGRTNVSETTAGKAFLHPVNELPG